MALHISSKLCAIGIVIAALITAFSTSPAPEPDVFSLKIEPTVEVLSEARLIPAVAVSSSPVGPKANPSFTLRATAYNSHVGQTDATPHITATGAQTNFGIVAVSRDLLGDEIPYGSLVRIKDLGSFNSGRGYGKFQSMLNEQGLFIVEDTMHPRKEQQIDVWFASQSKALSWGVRQVKVEVIRYGREGPVLRAQAMPAATDLRPRLAKAR